MKKYIIIFITILFVSCSNKSRVPDHVIPKKDMVDIIVDIHMLDGMLTLNAVKKEFEEKIDSTNYYNLIFEKYGYNRKDFDTSLYYYGIHINEYDEIYEEVLNKLTSLDADAKEQSRSTDVEKE